MASNFSVGMGGTPPSPFGHGFTVYRVHGCRIVFGQIPLPLSDFSWLSHGYSKKALVAIDIADLIGATLVVGEPSDLDALRSMSLPPSQKRIDEASYAERKGLPEVASWLKTGDRGQSSNAMCNHIFGCLPDAGDQHPCDPADLDRCLKFLDITHAHDKIDLMKSVSPQWDALALGWDSLIAIFRDEKNRGKSAPKTYALMQEILQ